MRFLSFGVCHSVAKLCARWASVRFRRTRSSSFRCFGIYNLSRMLSSYLPNRYISTANVHHHTRLEGPYRADGRSLRGQQTPVSGATPPRIAGALRPAPRASCTPRALHVPRDSVVYSGCSPPNGARLTRSTPRIPRTLPTLARKRGERKAAFSAILRHRAKPPPPPDRHALRHPQVRYPQYTNQNFDCPRSSQFREGFTNSPRFRPHHPVRPLQKACRPNAAKTFLPSIPYVHARPVHEKASFLATEPRSGTN